jgi:ABC-2 type transport system ATP-binding protein
MTVIETNDLCKLYRGSRVPVPFRVSSTTTTAIEDLNITVESGEVFGFLGPNGAGKSTTINLLLNFVTPTSGTVEVFGMDAKREAKAIHRRVGVLPERLGLWDRLTAEQHVKFVARAKEATVDPGELLARVGLPDARGKPVAEYSTGMRQRLGLGMALVGEPDLLVLDEPTAGLDPNGVQLLREIVQKETNRGAAVFFSSHVLGQVETISDRVGILRDGSIVAQNTIKALQSDLGMGPELTLTVDGNVPDAEAVIASTEGVTDVTVDGSELTVSCRDEDVKSAVIEAVSTASNDLKDVDVRERSLESLFSELTEQTGGDGS